MSTHLTPSDRTFMKHFAMMIAMLGSAAVVFLIIGGFVWASLPKEGNDAQVKQAGQRITPVAAVYAGKAGKAAVAAAAPASAPTSAAAAPSGPYKYDAAKGKSMFDSTCAACHQTTGEGLAGAFPPLKGNPAVLDSSPESQIETILNGRHGTVIDGKTYSGVMPPFGSQLSDVEIADIANYERSSWGNHAKHVTPTEVAKIRAKDK